MGKRITSTARQKKLARELVENSTRDKPLQKKELLSKVGYSDSTAGHKTTDIIESEGVKRELRVMGFTEENAMKVVSKIMLNDEAQDKDRLKAGEMVFKVEGTFAPEKRAVINLNVDIENKKAQELADKYEEELKDAL